MKGPPLPATMLLAITLVIIIDPGKYFIQFHLCATLTWMQLQWIIRVGPGAQ